MTAAIKVWYVVFVTVDEEEAIFCEGSCSGWLYHATCVGLLSSTIQYLAIKV